MHLLLSQQLLHQLGVVLRDVRDRLSALTNEPLQCEIISGRQRVVSVLLDLLLGILQWPLHLRILGENLFEDLFVDRNRLLATNYSRILFR